MLFQTQRKILMVEDNRNNHLLYQQSFTVAGFTVLICEDADGDFIAQVCAFSLDIISLDLLIGQSDRLAERDGFAALELLKADERTKHIPVMILTNFFNEQRVIQARALGAVDYINTPGQTIADLPQHFLDYLNNPRRFVPIHPAFATTE